MVWALFGDKEAGNDHELRCEQVIARFCEQVEANALGRFWAVTDSEQEIGAALYNPHYFYLDMLDSLSDVCLDAQGMYQFHHLLKVCICHREVLDLCVEESDSRDKNLYVVEIVLLYQVHDMSRCYLGGHCNL